MATCSRLGSLVMPSLSYLEIFRWIYQANQNQYSSSLTYQADGCPIRQTIYGINNVSPGAVFCASTVAVEVRKYIMQVDPLAKKKRLAACHGNAAGMPNCDTTHPFAGLLVIQLILLDTLLSLERWKIKKCFCFLVLMSYKEAILHL